MRKAVPPRDFAATVNALSLLRAGWAIAATLMVFSALAVVDLATATGLAQHIVSPLGAIVVSAAALAFLAARPSPARGVLFLGVGAAASFLYQYELLRDFPTLGDDGGFVLNRLSAALVLIGSASSRSIHGLLWCAAGLALGTLASFAAAFATDTTPVPGWGPAFFFFAYVLVTLMLDRIRRVESRTLPDFSQNEAEVARMVGRRQLEERAAAMIHDTVLSDLRALAMSGPTLDERARTRITRSLSALANASLRPPSEHGGTGALRDGLLSVIREFQWRGLTIDVSGGESTVVAVSPVVHEAVAGALHASLDNVLEHAGVREVDVSFSADERELTVTVVDHGEGFDPDAVLADRLGIRTSIVGRVEGAGGAVRVWSRPGAGTAVLITVPLEGARTPRDEPYVEAVV